MTLLEYWKKNDFNKNMIAKDMNFIVNAANWQDFFCRNSSGEKIRYCVPYGEETAYGRKTGICYSEESALKAIEFVLKEYMFLLVPWFSQDFNNSIDLTVESQEAIAITVDENNAQKEVFHAMFVFEKCQNKAGFMVSRVVPLFSYKHKQSGDDE